MKNSILSGMTLAGLGVTGSSLVRAIEPIKRPGSPRLLLSLAAYSFRSYFEHGNNNDNRPAGKRINLFDFIDYCADHGCQGAELTSYYFPPNIDEPYLLRLKHHAFRRGIEISGTAVGNTFTMPPGEKRDQQIASVKKWIDRAAIMGAPHIRVFAGNVQGADKKQAIAYCIEALEECAEYGGDKGVFIGLENHGGITSEPDDVLEIVRAVKSPWFGINLDTGNFHTDDPYGDLAKCAPYAVNVQIKVEMAPRGQKKQPADLKRLVEILRKANYQGYLALEYEAAEDPWETIPGYLKTLKALLA